MERKTDIAKSLSRVFESQNSAMIVCRSKTSIFLTNFFFFSWVSSLAIMRSRIVSFFSAFLQGNAFWQDSSSRRNVTPLESEKKAIVKALVVMVNL